MIPKVKCCPISHKAFSGIQNTTSYLLVEFPMTYQSQSFFATQPHEFQVFYLNKKWQLVNVWHVNELQPSISWFSSFRSKSIKVREELNNGRDSWSFLNFTYYEMLNWSCDGQNCLRTWNYLISSSHKLLFGNLIFYPHTSSSV